ncbi:MAG: glycosyltransferase family 4 protein, partial [Verrucomicrobiota bacterium]|nr:glycosyltransferase family 4 protein [Verrucomicrobiota bacterium]
VHICDHSNAMYTEKVRGIPVVVTCHDLLAVRGALGDETDTPASRTGKWLQRWIVSGLRGADAIACDSGATRDDAERIVTRDRKPPLKVITLGNSYPYQRLSPTETERRLTPISALQLDEPFVLHVGSNLRRKNREAVLRIFARCANHWPGQLVFAGEALNPALRAQAQQLGIAHRIVEVSSPSNELLEALYNAAGAFLFPSRFEGFGWPIAEAQACGCAVLCSSTEPMAEVAGAGALLREPGDEEGFAADLLRLCDADERRHWREKAFENAQRFAASHMISKYREFYRSVAPVC